MPQVGLGTDVSGGFSPSIMTAIQHASIASKIIAMQSSPRDLVVPHKAQFKGRQFSVATLLYLATLGGADVCNLKDEVGSFAPGKSFDALVVSVRNEAGNPGLWGVSEHGGTYRKEKEALEGMLENFLFCGDDRNISQVYVQGRLIGGKAFKK
jgi:guanine deaminase